MQSTASVQLLITFISSVSALGFHTASLCPYDASALANYTANKLVGTNTSAPLTWVSTPLAAGQSCPSIHFTPKAQRIVVTSFNKAEHNIDRYVPRSSTYALSIFRPSMVSSAHLDFDIVDAHGATIVPRMQITLGSPSSSSSQLTTLRTGRRSQQLIAKGKNKGKHATQPTRKSVDNDIAIITDREEAATQLPLFRKPSLGRRKGKGIGGGGRYGGGSGGFRTSNPKQHTKTYGYSSSALGKRFASSKGYSRTAYGYSGISVLYVGSWMHLYPRGPGHGSYRQICDRYTANIKFRCEQSLNSTLFSDGSTQPYKNRHTLIRDDLMAATVNTRSNITLPLTINIFKAAVVFHTGASPDPWDQPLFFSFSEVDFDDENDPIMSLVTFIVLVSLGSLVVVCILCCCCCSCGACDNDVRRFDSDVTSESAMPDLEAANSKSAQKQAGVQTW